MDITKLKEKKTKILLKFIMKSRNSTDYYRLKIK